MIAFSHSANEAVPMHAKARVIRPLVLAVDDTEASLELLRIYLGQVDCDVVTARNGFVALDAAANLLPDLVLLDVMMPVLDGYEVCRRLKADSATRLVPVVLVTSLDDVSDRIRSFEAGADDIISKPVDQLELVARVHSLLRIKEIHDRLDDSESVILALARAVEAKDGGTEAHVGRVGRAALALGEAVGLEGGQLHQLYLGGVIHDIGKIGVPDAILQKPGPLDPAEWDVMRRHVTIGVEIAAGLRSAAGLIPIIKHHHERFDGNGYPDRLQGSGTPLAARIVSICDAYDAMTTDRPYRRGMTPSHAGVTLSRGGGTQWDPDLVRTFLAARAGL